MSSKVKPTSGKTVERNALSTSGRSSFFVKQLNENPTPLNRLNAAQQLGIKKDRGAVGALIKALDRDGEETMVLRTIVWALGQIGGKKAKDFLVSLSKKRNSPLADEAKMALLSASLSSSKSKDFVK